MATLLQGLWSVTVAAAPLYRPQQVRRSLNTDNYVVNIQKNNQIDIKTASEAPIIENAFPSVTFESERQRPIEVDHRQSTRISVRNPLGQGNGIQFTGAEAIWTIATYPSQAFLTVDLTFINASKKPVTIARLSPFGIGEDGAVHLGPGTRILQSATESDPVSRTVETTDRSPGHLAAHGPGGASLIAGFITHQLGTGMLQLSRSPEATAHYDRFVCENVFNPPVTVPPGGQLQADTLYLAVVEPDPERGLERFVQASQRVEPYPVLAPSRANGWQLSEGGQADDWLQQLDAVKGLRRYGWSHVSLGTAWSVEDTPYALDSTNYPTGIAPFVETLHEKDLTVALSAPPPSDANRFAEFMQRCRTWGVDVVELAEPAMAESERALHPQNVLASDEIEEFDSPDLIYVMPESPGPASLEDWALASRHYYLPTIGNPLLNGWARRVRQETGHFTDAQFLTAWTLAAMQGALMRPTPDQTPARAAVLSRLLPAPTAVTARPVNLFQDELPQRWYLRLDAPAGDWTIVALFNWTTSGMEQVDTPLADLGLNDDNFYTVYDFWASRYLGLIQKQLRAEVSPEGVRLLGLRRFENRPMLVASDRHFTQGASDHTAITWSYEEQVLSGTFDGIADTEYDLTVLLPDPYTLKALTSSVPIARQNVEGNELRFSLQVAEPGPESWRIECTHLASK